jgi:Coatomer WD associated region
VLLTFDVEGGQYLLMQFDKDFSKARCITEKRGDALTAFFISKDRICVLDTNREVIISSFDGGNTKKWPILKKNIGKIDRIFPGPLGKILVQADDCLFLYDLSARKVISEVTLSDIKRIFWTP